MPRGYDRTLYILPFDHRGSFQTKLFGWKPLFGTSQFPLSDVPLQKIAAQVAPGVSRRSRPASSGSRKPARRIVSWRPTNARGKMVVVVHD